MGLRFVVPLQNVNRKKLQMFSLELEKIKQKINAVTTPSPPLPHVPLPKAQLGVANQCH